MDKVESIRLAIKSRRDVLGITQAHLADLAGVSLRTIAAIERGHGNPSLSTLCKLAEVLGVELKLVISQP